MEMINALSIDLEDWYHPELVRKKLGGSPVPQIEAATQPILDLLDRYETKASFFILGEVAEGHADLIQSIYERGHEIGCHGFSHKPLWELDENSFRKELERFHGVMERILGKLEIKGFRPHVFS
jgi:peptidoglycan/xylan/chitin deacetylase (PgdA/CDA1 family)